MARGYVTHARFAALRIGVTRPVHSRNYERFSNQLRDELAISPMPETVAVRRSILRNEALPGSPLPSGSANFVSTSPRVATVLPFVGRSREMAALIAAWSRAARGGGGMIVLGGEAGAGKSRLAAELARIAQGEGGRAFAGSTSAPESTPYQAIVGSAAGPDCHCCKLDR